MKLSDFLSQTITTEWLVEKLIPMGHKVLVAGKPGSGKSWFLEALAIHLAYGDNFLGYPVNSGKVLLIDEETPVNVLIDRLDQS